ncbi:MAG: response regulator [Pseudomonadota bacterium]
MKSGAYTRLFSSVLFFLSGIAAAVAQPSMSESWERLRDMELEQVRSLNDANDSPRYRLYLALLTVDENVAVASRHLTEALSAATPDSDEARLARMLQCSFGELQGSPLDRSTCEERGKSVRQMVHPFPAAVAQIHFGIWLDVNGQHQRSFQMLRLAEDLALASGDRHLAASTQNNLGASYLARGLPVQALKKFQAALEQVRAMDAADNESILTMLTSNIAATHLELGDFETANTLLQTLTQSQLYDRNNPIHLMDEAFLAKASLALGRSPEGFDRLSSVLDAVGSYGVPGTQAFARTVLAELQISLGKVDDAMGSFALAKDYAQRSGDPLATIKVELACADALIGLERYSDAGPMVDAAVDMLNESGPSMMLAQALDLRGDLLKASGQRVAANIARRQARQMQLRVAGTEHDMELVALGKSLELANQRIELAEAREQTRESEARAESAIAMRNTLVLTGLLLALITYLGLSRRYARKMAKTIQHANAELEAKVSERTAALEREMAERLDAESKRQALAKNLAEYEKLQALGQLTSGIAHDFNNLLTVVTLSAGQLREIVATADNEATRDVDNILAAAESATDITASLLAYVRKQPLTPQSTQLDSFLAESLPLFESTLGNGMSLATEIEPCSVRVDRAQLTTSVINLLLNAKEALKGQGNVVLKAHAQSKTDEQGETTDWVALSVADDGEGMTSLELRRATEPFFTTKDIGQGTGLGLSMVEGFAKQSGGFLDIDSEKGKGTSVTLFIPPDAESDQLQATPPDLAQELPLEGVVIVADDQAAIREVLCRLLEQSGLETLSAGSGAEALRILEQSECPDLLITDLMMPGEINGQQLAAEVRARFTDLPVLMMSGYTDSVELDVEFLHKPFSLDDLQNAVKRAIAQKRAA